MKQLKISRQISSIIIWLVLANFTAFSQGIYIKIGSGYQISSNPSFGQNTVSNTNSSVTTSTYTTNNIGFGKGFNFGAGVGYFFSPNLGAELGVNYLLGTKSEFTNESTNLNSNNNFSKTIFEISSRMLFVNPAVVLKVPNEKWSPYARVGFIMGFGNIIGETSAKTTNGNSSNQSYSKEKISGGIALGANGAFGVEYRLNNKLNVFGEVSVNSINYKPKKGETIEYTLNGNDILNTLSTREKITEFEDKYTIVSSNNPPNPNNPNKNGRISFPLSNISFLVGISFRM